MNGSLAPVAAASNPRTLLAVAACVLVTTAAVSGGGAALSAVADSGPVDTPATTAADAQTQSFPPGTNESGIVNATALLDAHERALRNTTYTERLQSQGLRRGQNAASGRVPVGPVSVTVRNGTTGTNTTVTARGSRSEYWVTDDAFAGYSVTTAGSVTSERYWYGDGNASGLEAGPTAVAQIQRGTLATYVQAANYSYRGTVARGDDTLYEFRAIAGNWSAGATDGWPSSAQRVDATVLVSERGVVREVSAVVHRGTQNGTAAARTNYSVTDIGETTASEPAWVDEQLPQFDVRVTDDSRVVSLEYTGGATAANATLPPQTGVFVFTDRDDAATQLGATLARGDTLYLWKAAGTDALQRSVDDPPTVTDSFASFEGANATYFVSRFVLTSATRGTMRSSTTIEVSLRNETAA